MKLIYGTVEQQDFSGALHKYRVRLSTGELSPWIPALVSVAGSDRHNHALSINTQVALMLDDYDGIILGAVNSAQKAAVTDRDTLNRTVYDDGTVTEYDSLNNLHRATHMDGTVIEYNSANNLHRATYMDGAVIEYDAANNALSAVLPAGATTELISDGGIAITGDITLIGNIIQTGNLTQTGQITSTGDHVAQGVSLVNHTHPGDSGGQTGAPS